MNQNKGHQLQTLLHCCLKEKRSLANYTVEASEVSQLNQSVASTVANVHDPGPRTTSKSMKVVEKSIVVNVDEEERIFDDR